MAADRPGCSRDERTTYISRSGQLHGCSAAHHMGMPLRNIGSRCISYGLLGSRHHCFCMMHRWGRPPHKSDYRIVGKAPEDSTFRDRGIGRSDRFPIPCSSANRVRYYFLACIRSRRRDTPDMHPDRLRGLTELSFFASLRFRQETFQLVRCRPNPFWCAIRGFVHLA